MGMMLRNRRFLYLALIVSVLLLAAGARFYNLGGQSLWYDEGVAYGHSQRSAAEIMMRLRDNVHVPAYFVSLAWWEDATGSSEFALRAYSALWGVVSVAGTFALGRRLFSPLAALTAAVFVGLNSFSVYYGQEARMYAMLSAVAVLSMTAFVMLVQQVERNRDWRGWWRAALALSLLNTLGAYTHVSYALVMLTQGVMAVIWMGAFVLQGHTQTADLTLRQRLMQPRLWRFLGVYVALNSATLILFAPWLTTITGQVAAQPNISEALPLPQMIGVLLGWLAFGVTHIESAGGLMAAVLFLLIFALLTVPNARGRGWWALLLPVVWVLLSAGMYLGLGLYERYLRFLLPAQIGFALWLARGIWSLWHILPRTGDDMRARLSRVMPKVAAVVSAAALCIALLRGLPVLYHDAAFQRDDYRGLAQTIADEARDDAAVIVSAAGVQEIYGYYGADAIPVYPLPLGDDVVAETAAIINDHEQIFGVFYGTAEQDPDGLVRETLNSAALPIGGEWIGDVRLERFVAPDELSQRERINARFGGSITLTDYALNDTDFQAGETLQLALTWQSDQPLEQRYKVFVQILDGDGVLVTQRDSEPAGGQRPTITWEPDTAIRDLHALPLRDLAAGEYTLIVGLYDANNPSARLPVADGDYLALGTLTITE